MCFRVRISMLNYSFKNTSITHHISRFKHHIHILVAMRLYMDFHRHNFKSEAFRLASTSRFHIKRDIGWNFRAVHYFKFFVDSLMRFTSYLCAEQKNVLLLSENFRRQNFLCLGQRKTGNDCLLLENHIVVPSVNSWNTRLSSYVIGYSVRTVVGISV